MENSRIYLSPPYQTGDELVFLEKALASNWLAPAGPHLAEFEQAICNATGFKYAVATTSGTAALHLGLIVQGINEGDEVLVSTLTFVGSVNPVTYLRAKPIFVDSRRSTWNIDVDLVEAYVRENQQVVKAIIPTHLFGMPADVDALERISKTYQVPIIHDMAECLGGRVKEKKLGTRVQRGILSFNGNKMVTTSGGGAFVTNDKHEADQALYLAQQARSEGNSYTHKTTGYNYRMSNVLSSLGLAQIKSLDLRVARKKAIHERYLSALQSQGFSFQLETESICSDRWLTAVLFDKGIHSSIEEVVLKMDQANIEVRPIWKPMHMQPVFEQETILGGEVAEHLFGSGLCLPSGCGLTNAEQDYVIEQLLQIS